MRSSPSIDSAARLGSRCRPRGARRSVAGYRDMSSYAAVFAARASPVHRWAVIALIDEDEVGAELWSAMRSTSIGVGLRAGRDRLGRRRPLFAHPDPPDLIAWSVRWENLPTATRRIALEGENRQDEIGDMARSVAVFRQRRNRETRARERKPSTAARQAKDERRERDAEKAAEQARLTETVEVLGAALQRLASGDLTATIDKPFASGLRPAARRLQRLA